MTATAKLDMAKTIKISDTTHAKLAKLGSIGQTFEDVILMLIKEHEEKTTKEKPSKNK